MNGPVAALLKDGKRLHLQHGPIDLIIGADGERKKAFAAAQQRFATILEELVAELPELRTPLGPDSQVPLGPVARRMHQATNSFVSGCYLTRMAAVAGSVADEVLEVMINAAQLSRAYVNNGGDIALHLAEGTEFSLAMAHHSGRGLGHITVRSSDPVRGIATSGRHGRSHSLGIAESVTVLAKNAADADAAATLIANAVDLPHHPGIRRKPANELDDNTDLGHLPVVCHCPALPDKDIGKALTAGEQLASKYVAENQIAGAALFLQGEVRTVGQLASSPIQRMPEYA